MSVEAITPNDLSGRVTTQDGVIIFEKVPIITPNGDVLVRYEKSVDRQMHLILTTYYVIFVEIGERNVIQSRKGNELPDIRA